MQAQGLLTVKELSSYLGVSPWTIYRRVKAREIPFVSKPGLGIRFRKEEIDEWLDQGAFKPSPLLEAAQDMDLLSKNCDKIQGRGGLSEMAKAKYKTRYNFGFGAIYQRKTKQGNIRWYLDYRDARGKRVQRVAKHAVTAENAKLALHMEITMALNRSCGIGASKKRIDFKGFSQIYLENYATMKKRSWETDKKYLDAQLVPCFGGMELHEITPLHVSQFMAKRLKDGVRKSTINRELTVLKKALNLALEWCFELVKNPVVKGNFFSEEEYKRNRVLSLDEESKLFEVAAFHLQAILVCALNTGMRVSEILGLTWPDVDLERGHITVKAESSKSGRARVIPVNKALAAVLSVLKTKAGGKQGHVFLYQDPATGKQRPVKTIRKAFNQACRRAGIKNLRFHDLRHTFGSRLSSRGADLVSVKNLLGHANLKTTEVYLHSSLGQMEKAVSLLDGSGAPSSPNPSSPLHICDTGSRKESQKFTNGAQSVN
jgi:excisionase family DNA binding protein